ncbi:unannotated protein [freshwater metagenome]|uniref:Unannotated protein n=1 Tax=freshwater metagenome TaxID=449393 RepID=A0A6J7CUB2_9ZZZZ|nr:amidase family protein [Actinomycetota bacterium]MUH57730.1 amidase [Actinomycetota bacterium]
MTADPHPSSAAIAYASVGDLLDRLEEGSLTSEQLVATLLDRIANIDAPSSPIALRAIAAIAPDALTIAVERDAERARGTIRGPLHGIPVIIKDNIESLGLPGAAGSTALRQRETRDSPLVQSLRAAGAIVMASTNLSEWANMRSPHSTSGWSATGGLVGNPWRLDRSAGGSSSGSGAALAAGLAPLAVGTETDGSIICPASLNGVVGLKPTVGLVSTEYVVPISASQDTPGPMGRTVTDVARLFSVLSGQPLKYNQDKELRFVAAINWRTGHAATDQAFETLVLNLRASGELILDREVAIPGEQEEADEITVLIAELGEDLSLYLASRPGVGVTSINEVIAYEDEHFAIEQPHFGHEFLKMAAAAGGRSTNEYRDARVRNLTWAVETCLSPALADADILIAPAYGPAWKSDLTIGGHASAMSSGSTMPSAVAGWPLASLPIGLVDGLPIGITISGRPHDEWTILAAARRIEAVVGATVQLPRASFLPPQRG